MRCHLQLSLNHHYQPNRDSTNKKADPIQHHNIPNDTQKKFKSRNKITHFHIDINSAYHPALFPVMEANKIICTHSQQYSTKYTLCRKWWSYTLSLLKQIGFIIILCFRNHSKGDCCDKLGNWLINISNKLTLKQQKNKVVHNAPYSNHILQCKGYYHLKYDMLA